MSLDRLGRPAKGLRGISGWDKRSKSNSDCPIVGVFGRGRVGRWKTPTFWWRRSMSETKPTNSSVGQVFLAESRRRLAASHQKIRHCLDQLDDAQVWWRARESMNSIGNLVLHLCGNLRQWVVSGVGGAADVRDRPGEFSQRALILKDELLQRFDAVVREADAVLAGTAEDRLREPRRIQ